MDSANPEEVLTTSTLARFLKCSTRTLERLRVTGAGPQYFKVGSDVRYMKSQAIDWASGKTRRSTSEQEPIGAKISTLEMMSGRKPLFPLVT